MSTGNAAGDALRYIQSWPPGMLRYWLALPSCCQQAFVAADTARDGNPETHNCRTHGHVDLAVDLVARAIEMNGKIERFRVWACSCGQRNRVDVAKVVGWGSQVKCGKCGEIVKAPS